MIAGQPPPDALGARNFGLERHARNRDVGLKGERLVFDYERRWLLERGRPDLADRVVHVSVELGHGAGYDVRSFLLDETPITLK